jgi:transcriptional regulator with XRE-family HTH domain
MSMAPELRLLAPRQENGHSARKHYHRLRAVRVQQGVSRRVAAGRLGVEPRQLDSMEDPSTDLPLSALYQWQQMLQVPIEDLLVDSEAPLSRPVLERAQMLKVMKTAVTIRNRASSKAVRHLAEMLVDQLQTMLPDMKEVGPWTSHAESLLDGGSDVANELFRAEREFLTRALEG